MINAAGLLRETHALVSRAGGIHVPPEVIASWPTPNYISPVQRTWGAPVALSILLVVTLLVYAARMWARLTMTKNAGVDDVLISISMIFLIALSISTILGVTIYGFQWHMWDQTPATKTTTTYVTMAIELSYMISTTLIKISILLFYRRLTGSLTNRFIYLVWICIVACILYFVSFIILIFFACSVAVGRKDCAEEGPLIVSVTTVSTVQDLVICLLPTFLIRNLQMPKTQKLAVCGIFGLGLVTTICGIMRLYYSVYLYYFTYDATWYAYYGWIWTVLEADLALICASAPALRVFFRHSLGLMSSHTGNPRSGANKTSPGILSNRATHSGPLTRNDGSKDLESKGDNIYLDSILVERGLSSTTQERDDASQKSDSSTRNLTTIIHGPMSK
ncbi:hypothetical protein COCC4DRAFT_204357 [Bipolaris maydis ATCC 48331]|uniref:Rhodopsin domain-containing protein n=2 Tax=Cochliobolus heterostrophus TaxID=5016 RepID=M2U7M6_COCH5|nr:uncharacterized protein COCC4DRAFT_204357 [Bipolaris maydis ATCC 48331]EMD94519.1 hypothetical protein COCHEDRAFT_1192577 [Bipolaris maydis C5]KAJ5026349.1 hypothetical protein J3E73DRAFT_231608 [Bipolaris maydis]ENI01137.1 hypothetical protein COCC4DRAFT_204357 [Bipolaris maydis ATCC 48331]KAJ5059933.1 hypothetical protein J3E74DRAFT_273365 [Bipolaris maydis]KAJ6197101.1 hypothetical protein J3E72DRAFT_242044 [Bipolaris maydis]